MKEEKERKRENHASRRERGEIVDSDEDAYEDFNEAETGSNNGLVEGAHANHAPAVVGPGIGEKREGDHEIGMKKRRLGVNNEVVSVGNGNAGERMNSVFLACYKCIESAQVVDQDGYFYFLFRFQRQRAELFLTLPDPSIYEDYYVLIKTPIAMDMILKRIHSSYYGSVGQFSQEVDVMFGNAMRYNVEGSEVYYDALKLQEIFRGALGEFAGSI